MLLRRSRAAEELDKLAFIGAIGKGLRGVGKFLSKDKWKWGKRLGGGALVGGATASGVAEATGQSRGGLGQRSFQMRQQGLMPPGIPKVPKI